MPASQAAVPAPLVVTLLECIACSDVEIAESETWIAPDGHFRLGPLMGAWSKPAAAFIGYAARAAARS